MFSTMSRRMARMSIRIVSRKAVRPATFNRMTPAFSALTTSQRSFCSEDKYFYSRCAVTEQAPAFKEQALMPDGSFAEVSLEDYKGKYVVLFFYPADFTFVCPTEIIEFSERYADFKALDCEVIGCSSDSKFVHHAWTQVGRDQGGLGEMNIPLLADTKNRMSQDYGFYLEAAHVNCTRGLVIINEDGKVRHMQNNDLPVGRNVDDVLRLVRAFQHVDKHGEVCPAKWNAEGDATIKEGVDSKMDYFSKVN